MMRGTPGMRLLLAILSPVLLLLFVVAIRSEEMREWMRYQEEFKELYIKRATVELQEAQSRGDAKEEGRWQRVIEEVSGLQPEIAQVYLEDLEVADRCVTCHRGVDSGLFRDAPEPFRTHPGDMLKHHDVSLFACTPCHQGQGVATTAEAAHRGEENWLKPMLPGAYVQSSCARCHEVTHGVKGAETVSRGANLFLEQGCYGCHDVKGVSYLPKFGSPLTPIKSKLADAERWLYTWVKDPPGMKPDTAMPNFKLEDDKAGKITAFLLTLPEGERYSPVALEGASAEEGENLFTERGCRGCHAVKADEHSGSRRIPHLAGVGSKVTREWLDSWIAKPKDYNPDTAMPKVELTDDERRAVVAYLLTLEREEPLPAPPDLGQFDAEEGKKLAKRYECFGCHVIEGFEEVRPAVPDLGEFARRPVDELDFGTTTDVPLTKWDWLQRKLREPRAYERENVELWMPVSAMTDEEEQAVITYQLGFEMPALPARYSVSASAEQRALANVSWMVARLGCPSCHPFNKEQPRVADFFERKTMTPPTLDGVGARLQGQYMYEFLLEPKALRPWLKMRMPTFDFSEEQARALVQGFAAAATVTNPYTYVAKATIPQDRFQRGIRRFRHYKCVQCHPTSIDQGLPEDVDPDDLSINLMLTKTRLRPEWIKDFMERPKEIAGIDTRMPTVFYTVDGVPKVERPRDDIEDITIYLMGMVEPPEVTLKAEEEAIKAEEEETQIDWSQVEY